MTYNPLVMQGAWTQIPLKAISSSSSAFNGHIPKGVWGRKSYWRRAFCMKNLVKKVLKFGFIILILFVIIFLLETIFFKTKSGVYLGWQDVVFGITVVIGVIAFLCFITSLFVILARKMKVLRHLRGLLTKTALITIGLICILGVVIIYVIKTAPSRIPEAAKEAQTICGRASPYSMPPALQRAISLLIQRYAEHNEPNLAEYQQMLNCLNIQFSDIHRTASNTEGYFTFDTRQSSLDNQIVAVDAAFNDYDDLTAAVILSHELTHAKQYVDELAYRQSLSCVDKEVFAFKQEVFFYTYLNTEEQRSLLARAAQGDQNNPELAQLSELVNMAHVAAVAVNGGQNRAFAQAEQQQYDALLESKIRQMIVSIPEYKTQCNL